MSERLYQLKYAKDSLYYVESTTGGKVPASLSGGYTSTAEANKAIKSYTKGCFKPAKKKTTKS